VTETAPSCEPDNTGMTKPCRVRRPPKLPKYVLPNRDNLDGRTHAAKAFDKLYGEIAQDLGGELRS
jgi:hypothetical protein